MCPAAECNRLGNIWKGLQNGLHIVVVPFPAVVWWFGPGLLLLLLQGFCVHSQWGEKVRATFDTPQAIWFSVTEKTSRNRALNMCLNARQCCRWSSPPLAGISHCLLLNEHPPQGCASKTALSHSFFFSFSPDSARRQSIQSRKVLVWGWEKVLTREAGAKELRDCWAFLPPFCVSLLWSSWGERTVGYIFVLLRAHFVLRSPAERGYAAWSARPCWNAYNAVWRLWLLLI